MRPFAEIVSDQLRRRRTSAIRSALDAGLNRDAIRSVLRGRVPSVERAAEICDALDLELYIGPTRGTRSVEAPSADAPAPSGGRASAADAAEAGTWSAGAVEKFTDRILAAVRAETRAWGGEIREQIEQGLTGALSGARPSSAAEGIGYTGAFSVRAADEEDVPGTRPVEMFELAAAAGGGAINLDDAPRRGPVFFRRDWLDRHGIDPTQCSVIGVVGESMEPTLPDGCSILVDRNRRRRRVGGIFVVRVPDEGVVAKRLGKDKKGGWQLISDNPAYPPVPWPHDAEVIGEVKWTARDFS